MRPSLHHRAALLAAVLTFGAGSALAAERLALTWSAPPGCPGADDVKVEVDRLLGGSRVRPAKAIDVTGAVAKDERGTWHVRLETPAGGATRAREIHGASCKAVTDAAALVLALMIDPDAVATTPPAAPPSPSATGTDRGPPPPSATGTDTGAPPPSATGTNTGASPASGEPASGAATSLAQGVPGSSPGLAPSPGAPPPQGLAPATAPLRTPTLAPAPEPPARLPTSLRVGVWSGADAGSLPGVSAGFGGGVALVLGRQRIELGVAGRLPTRAHLADRPTAGGSVSLITGSLGTCRTLVSGAFEAAPCVAVEAGRLGAGGFGVTSPASAEQPWIAASGGGLFTLWLVPRFGLAARIDAVIPLVRSTFVLEGLGPVHTPSAVVGRASLGAELRF